MFNYKIEGIYIFLDKTVLQYFVYLSIIRLLVYIPNYLFYSIEC